MDAYRIVIEVLKFTSPRNVLRETSVVNSKWNESSESRELWYHFLPPHTRTDDQHPKGVYREQFTTSVFVVLEERLLRFYTGSETWRETPLSKALKIDWTSSVVRIDFEALFVCGVDSRLENTFQVGVHSGRVKKLPSLTPHRCGMGVIRHEGVVLAFCGKNSTGQSEACSRFVLKSSSWAPLPNARVKRSFFNPCQHGGLIYLVGGGEDKDPTEVYNFAENSFRQLSWKSRSSSIAVFVGSELFLCNEEKVKRGELSTQFRPHKAAIPRYLGRNFTSGYTPILLGTKLIILQRSENRIVKLDLQSLEWVQFDYTGGKIPNRKRAVRPAGLLGANPNVET